MGIVPGKVFEYLASEQPILAIGPSEGDSARILRSQAGTHLVGFEEPIEWPAIVEMCANKPYRKDTLTPYSRKELSLKIHALLLELVQK